MSINIEEPLDYLDINTDGQILKNWHHWIKIIMHIEAGFKFVFFLFIFSFLNYLIMLARYENDLKKIKIAKKNKIAKLYPANTFIKV